MDTINRDAFITSVEGQVKKYIYLKIDYDPNAQIRVNPELKLVDLLSGKQFQQAIGFSDEVIENGAYGEGDETSSADDYQASQDPDFYPVSTLVKKGVLGELLPDMDAIQKLADNYFTKKL